MTKTSAGNFFEDFRLGQTIRHATPRTLTDGDVALYTGLFGAASRCSRRAPSPRRSATATRRSTTCWCSTSCSARSVPDISLNAVANLGYAGCQFLAPVYPGDTLTATSEVIGLKENSNRKTGVVYVRTRGFKQDGTAVLEYVRWVMVHKRDAERAGARRSRAAAADRGRAAAARRAPARRSTSRPTTSSWPAARIASATTSPARRSTMSTASRWRRPSTRSRRGSTRTPRASISTSSRRRKSRFGRRLIYGGHAISLARALSFNGLGQRVPHRGDQRRPPRRAAVRGRHGVRLDRGAGDERIAGPHRRRRAAAAHRRHQGPAVPGFPVQGRRRVRPRRHPRSRLLGADPATRAELLSALRRHSDCPRRMCSTSCRA